MPEEVKQQVFTDMVVSSPVLLDSEAGDGKVRARWKATQANVINDNARMYPFAVMTDGIERSKQAVSTGRMVGESPHPKHFVGKVGQVVFDTSIDNSVIKIYNQFMDDSKTVYVDAEVLDTAKGRDLQALIKAGIPVGISMRALGDSVRKNVNGVMVDVATKLDILSYDVVMNPATPGCEVVSVLTDSQVEAIMTDDVQITIPDCPKCGNRLTPQDPDGDNDLDFYSCEPCKEVYIPDESKTVEMRAYQTLRTLPNDPDYDGWDLARKYKAKMNGTGFTDATQQKGDEQVDIKEILKAMQDSPELQAMIDAAAEAKAKTIAQPALDHMEQQRTAQEAAEAKVALKVEAKTFVDSRLAELKTGGVHEKAIGLIADKVKDVETKEQAALMIDSLVSVYSDASSKAFLDSVGFVGGEQAVAGQVRVGHEHKPWEGRMKSMLDAMDREMVASGHTIRQSIRDVNKPYVDKLIEHAEKTAVMFDSSGNPIKHGYEAMKDSVAFLDSAMQDSVSVTTQQILNQPSISQLLMVQAFQDTESMQFLTMDTFDGDEIRYQTEIYQSVAAADPTTGLLDLLSGEGQGIAESSIKNTYQSYDPKWRRNAISFTTDVARNMLTGPTKYDVMARGIYHISYEKRRIFDNLAYLEMTMNSDEYAPIVVQNEVPATSGSNELVAVNNTTNVKWSYSLTVGGQKTATAGSNPVVRSRKKLVHNPDGSKQTLQLNPFTVTVGATTLTMGYLDPAGSGNIIGGDYAVDYENGFVYYQASAGLNPTAGTPILPSHSYSAVTNYDRWSLTPKTGYDTDEAWYSTLITQVTTSAAFMGSAPRFKRPNVSIMSMNTAARIQNATMWYKLNDPQIGHLNGMATSTIFGARSDVNFAQINAPWIGGDNRILLTQRGSTKYGVQTPYQIEGPFPKYDPTTGNIVDAKVFFGRENSLFCTPQAMDSNYNALNPVSRTVKIVP